MTIESSIGKSNFLSNGNAPTLSGRGPALGGPGCDVFTLHVFRVLVRICRTSKMTACSAPAVVASRTSFSLLGLIGIGRWHRSRVPRVLPEHHTLCAVSALTAFCVAAALLSVHHTVTTHSGSMSTSRPSSDTLPSRAVSGFMSDCHHSPTANEARQHPRVGAWCMHRWASMIRCDPVK